VTALRFEGVRKRFGSVQALRGLDLDVPRGSLFGLIGPNGAGKTTAFAIACGFLQADAGQVSVLDGGPFDAVKLKGRMTALPQDAVLAGETRCLDHLLFYGRLQGLDAATARRDADRVLEEVGLAEKARAKARTLSHGMLRRLTVAQALLGKPELVLLDEPTSGLDPRHAHDLRELLRRTRSDDRTILVSSHNLPELESLCDHVAFMDKGVSVASGATDVVTGRGQEVRILLGTGPTPVEAVARALPAAQVKLDGRTVVVIFSTGEAEDVIGQALRVLLDAGARIAEVKRGTSLEKKFLEMT
jgi:ABC-2 type transport system ATP-binding protein